MVEMIIVRSGISCKIRFSRFPIAFLRPTLVGPGVQRGMDK
jgi:hypothetical protein